MRSTGSLAATGVSCLTASRVSVCARVRRLCTGETRGAALGAYGGKGSKGSGKSLMGSKARGRGAHLTMEELAALERGELQADLDLDAGDVLMEVLAEDHRHRKDSRSLEFLEGGGQAAGGDNDEEVRRAEPRIAHRQYLTDASVGPGTMFQRQQAAQQRRLEIAQSNAFDYHMPKEAKAAREHERRSRAKMREHDVVENRIQEAMATGAFDNLPGAGKPLKREENVFEQISGDAMAHRILKNAGIAPGWVEQRKEIRAALAKARIELALDWASCVPVWPLPPPPPELATFAIGTDVELRLAQHASRASVAASAEPKVVDAAPPGAASGGWRIYRAPAELQDTPATDATRTAAAADVADEAPRTADEAPRTADVAPRTADVAPVAATASASAAEEAEPSEDELKAREQAAAAAAALARALAADLAHAAAASGPQPALWAASIARFHEELKVVNKMIDSFNLSVPASWQQIHKLQPAAELTRALHEAPQRVQELKAERRSLRAEAEALAASSSGAGRSAMGAAALFGGAEPSFAVRQGPYFPNVFEALASALFSR